MSVQVRANMCNFPNVYEWRPTAHQRLMGSRWLLAAGSPTDRVTEELEGKYELKPQMYFVTSLQRAGVVERLEGGLKTHRKMFLEILPDVTPHPCITHLHPSESRDGNTSKTKAAEPEALCQESHLSLRYRGESPSRRSVRISVKHWTDAPEGPGPGLSVHSVSVPLRCMVKVFPDKEHAVADAPALSNPSSPRLLGNLPHAQ
ncbi:hypothetical protein FQN60_016082 [Etheostoma spectabile]|uniref:Uncharacterized protein n=1 Tax=Etheostoma spectabile TaxID=54343 RepID=A0A5J5D2W1_9PERO|nr:hypothetical protein FQN60_016082 [Etheostoma spectabile]